MDVINQLINECKLGFHAQGAVPRGMAWMACSTVLHGRTEGDSCEALTGSHLLWDDDIVAATLKALSIKSMNSMTSIMNESASKLLAFQLLLQAACSHC